MIDKNKSNFEGNTDWKPGFLKNDEFINLMCEVSSFEITGK